MNSKSFPCSIGRVHRRTVGGDIIHHNHEALYYAVQGDRSRWKDSRLWQSDGSGADGGDGRWGREELTVQRASTPDDGWRRGRALDPAVAAGAE